MNSQVTISWPTLLAGTLIAFSAQTACQSTSRGESPWRDGLYRTEIVYPNGEIRGSITLRNHPLTIRNGYRFNQLPFLPRLSALKPAVPRYLTAGAAGAADLFQSSGGLPPAFWRPPPSAASLFTPAAIKQPAETLKQIEAYNKALKEEAEQAEKESLTQQGVTGMEDFADVSDFDTTSSLSQTTLQPTSFVDVRVDGDKQYKYKYSY